MRTITGKICGLLSNSAGEINGIVLDGGQSVEFPPQRASQVFSIATLGSRVEVRALIQDGAIVRTQFTGVLIRDLSFETVCLPLRFHLLPTARGASRNLPSPGYGDASGSRLSENRGNFDA